MAHKLTARERLRIWCRPRGRTAELARATSAARSTVYRWLGGDTVPSPIAAVVIEHVVGIGRSEWERARSERRAA